MASPASQMIPAPSALPANAKLGERLESLLNSEQAKLDQNQLTYVRANWLDAIAAARRRRRWSRFWFRTLRFIAVGGALTLPALASINLGASSDIIRYSTFAISIVVALSTGGLQVFRFEIGRAHV